MIRINSESWVVGQRLPDFSQEEIKNEPMLFNCDISHAYKLGGTITRAFLDAVPIDWHDVGQFCVIDTRVHMLMQDWYPCIPGYHHDDVPRSRSDGQPNYINPEYRSTHLIALINGDICPTRIAVGSANFSEIPLGNVIYRQWHDEVVSNIKHGTLQEYEIESNRLHRLDDRTWHTGSAAKKQGWRWFGRISRYLKQVPGSDLLPVYTDISRPNPRTNEVRKQVQVYLNPINRGW